MRGVVRATTLAEVNVINLNQNISRHLWAAMPAGDGLFLAIGQLKVIFTQKQTLAIFCRGEKHDYTPRFRYVRII